MLKKILIFASIFAAAFPFAHQVDAQKEQILAISKKTVTALKNKNLSALAKIVHPIKGLRFAPYCYLSESDLKFKRSEIPGLFADRRSFLWGEYDGTGDPIKMGFSSYYKKFVYGRNFSAVRGSIINGRQAGGNTVLNGAEVYPKGKFVSYHQPGTEKYGGMDWSSLILVFEKSGRNWYLVAVVHDEWTI